MNEWMKNILWSQIGAHVPAVLLPTVLAPSPAVSSSVRCAVVPTA